MTNYSNTTIVEKTIKTGVNKHENVRRCLDYLHFPRTPNAPSDDSI